MSAGGVCRVTRLRLHRFRNYDETTLRPGAELNVFAGRNAQGKTNLLEAVATLALTRSPRAAAAGDLLQWGASGAQVEADVQRSSGDLTLTARFERAAPPAPVVRRTLVDGSPRAARAVLGLCPVVLFWPDDLHLVKGGPDGRRRLVDVLLSQLEPATALHLVRYRRVVEQRNALLHRLRAAGSGVTPELRGFDHELAEHGAHIVVARRRLLERLAPAATDALARLSSAREELTLRYVPSHGGDGDDDTGACETALLAALTARAADELARGMTLIGPHRDDIDIDIGGRPARHTASQGQQRSIVLACKIAEMRCVREVTGLAPVVLLDDVVSELDAERRRALLEALATPPVSQVLVTTTESLPDAALFGSVCRFTVDGGSVREDAA